jgi:hypothetical protein
MSSILIEMLVYLLLFAVGFQIGLFLGGAGFV